MVYNLRNIHEVKPRQLELLEYRAVTYLNSIVCLRVSLTFNIEGRCYVDIEICSWYGYYLPSEGMV